MDEELKPKRRFLELTTKEVSLVDAGANGAKYAVTKRSTAMTVAKTETKVQVEKSSGEIDGWASLDIWLSPEQLLKVLVGLTNTVEVAKSAAGTASVEVSKSADGAAGPSAEDLKPLAGLLAAVEKEVTSLQTKFPNLKAPISAPAGSGSVGDLAGQAGAGKTVQADAPLNGGAAVQDPGVAAQMLANVTKSVDELKAAVAALPAGIAEAVSKAAKDAFEPGAILDPLKAEIAKAVEKVSEVEQKFSKVEEAAAAAATQAKEAVEKAAAVRPPPLSAGDTNVVPVAKSEKSSVSWEGIL